jgi:O-antigen/teichoic acid export membrane protein
MSLGKHTAANFAGAGIPMLVALATIPVYLRLIGEDRYGVLAVVWSVVTYFSFLDLGFGRAVAQRLARTAEADGPERSEIVWTGFLVSFTLGLIGGCLLYFAAVILVDRIPGLAGTRRHEAALSLPWLILAFPLLLPGTVLSGALQARLRFVEMNLIQILGNLLGQLLPLVMALLGHVELHYLVPTVLFSRIVTNTLLFTECRRHLPLMRVTFAGGKHLGPLVAYGGWVSVMNVIAPLLVTVDRVVIGAISGARAVTYYTVPYDLISRGMVVSSSFSSALFPRLAKLSNEDGRVLAREAAMTLLSIMSPLTALGLLIAHPFIAVWVGRNFAEQTRGVPEILLLGIWANAVAVPHYSRFLARETPRKIVMIYIAELPFYLAALWYGVHEWGALGAACAWTFRVVLDSTLLLHLNAALRQSMRSILPALLFLGVAFASVFVIHTSVLQAAMVVLAFACYAYAQRSVYASTLSLLGIRGSRIA